MSLSDLDYVNAAVSRSEVQQPPPRTGSLGGATRSTAESSVGRTNETSPEEEAQEQPDSSSPGGGGGGGGGVPSLAALLASLESVTIDAQRLGVSASTTALFASSDRPAPPRGRGPSPSSQLQGQNGNSDEDEEDLDPDSLRQLLAKLDETEGAADDLEGRLDGLIDNLDKLLGALGGGAAAASIDGDDPSTPADE